jgi:IPT/TIG domain
MRMRVGIVPALIAQIAAGCGSSAMPASAVAPTVAATPSVTSILPNVGSISGATAVKIAGTNLGTTVTFGGASVQGRFFAGNPTMYISAPAHAAGTVDVVVSGQGGQSVKLTDAYTYVSPMAFDFNGEWASYGENDQDGLIFFTIRDNLLRSVSCGPDVTLTFSPPRPVTNGEFSFVRDDGVGFSGRIVAVSDATGTIKLGSCESNAWHGRKQ